jgi:hypothetical protein
MRSENAKTRRREPAGSPLLVQMATESTAAKAAIEPPFCFESLPLTN